MKKYMRIVVFIALLLVVSFAFSACNANIEVSYENMVDSIYQAENDGIICVQKGAETYYLNSKGAEISAKYKSGTAFVDGTAVVSINDKFGIVNKKFEVLAEGYDVIRYFPDNKIFFAAKENKTHILSSKGKSISVYDGIKTIGTKNIVAFNKVEGGENYFILDGKGKELLSVGISDSASTNDLGYVTITNSLGYLALYNDNAKLLIPAAERYDDFDIYEEGIVAERGTQLSVLDCKGKLIYTAGAQYDSIYYAGKYLVFDNGFSCGLFTADAEPKAVLDMNYQSINYVDDDNTFIVRKDGNVALINNSFKNLTGFIYSGITPLGNGRYYAAVGNDAYRLITKSGKALATFSGQLVASQFYGKYMTLQNADVTDHKYYYLTNTAGKATLKTANYVFVGNVSDGLACFGTVVEGKVKYGFCNPKGKVVIAAEYDAPSQFEGGKAIVVKGTKQGVIDTKNKAIVAIEYDSIITQQGAFFASAYANLSEAELAAAFDVTGLPI